MELPLNPSSAQAAKQPIWRYISGVTLVEMMVAITVFSIAGLAMLTAFPYIAKSLFLSRNRTIANNLLQEKIQYFKNLPYNSLYPSPSTSQDNNFSPPIVWGSSETITNGNTTFIRYSYVNPARVDTDVIQSDYWVVGNTYEYDMGLKQVTVWVVWQENGHWKQVRLSNIRHNPSNKAEDTNLNGIVYWSSGASSGILPGAWVRDVAYGVGGDTSRAGGDYYFAMYHGTSTFRVSAPGYYDVVITSYVPPGSLNQNFYMTAIATASVTSNVWFNPNLVISQVVTSTINVQGLINNFQTEYIELFNPTTTQINMVTDCSPAKPPCTSLSNNPPIQLNIDTKAGGNTTVCNNVQLIYMSTYVPAGFYYLIANSSYTLSASAARPMSLGTGNGTVIPVVPDAIYSNSGTPCSGGTASAPIAVTWSPTGAAAVKHLLQPGKSGSVAISNSAGSLIDAVGWKDTSASPIPNNFTAWSDCLPDNTNCLPISGLSAGNQIVRVSSPEATPGALGSDIYNYNPPSVPSPTGYGQAYNSGNNRADFLYNCVGGAGCPSGGDGVPGTGALLTYLPNSTTSWLLINNPPVKTITGVPAINALVRVSTDPFSGSTQTITGYMTSPVNAAASFAVAPFKLIVTTTSAGAPWYVEVATVTNMVSATGNQMFWKEVSPIPVSGVLGEGMQYAIPNLNTYPRWPHPNDYSLILDSAPPYAFVAGMISGMQYDIRTSFGANCGPDLTGMPTPNPPPPYRPDTSYSWWIDTPCPAVQISVGGQNVSTGLSGLYFSPANPGSVTVVFNTAAIPPMGSETRTVSVVQNQIAISNWKEPIRYGVTGYVWDGTNHLPGIMVTMFVDGGNEAMQATTDSNGLFTLEATSGTYTVQPTLDPGAGSSPAFATFTVAQSAINVGTFTVTGALANISGTVYYNTVPVGSGALILASTATIPSTLPPIKAANAMAGTSVFSAVTHADGTYTLPVRQANGYNLKVYIPTVNGTSVSVSSKPFSGYNVGIGGLPGQNLSLP